MELIAVYKPIPMCPEDFRVTFYNSDRRETYGHARIFFGGKRGLITRLVEFGANHTAIVQSMRKDGSGECSISPSSEQLEWITASRPMK